MVKFVLKNQDKLATDNNVKLKFRKDHYATLLNVDFPCNQDNLLVMQSFQDPSILPRKNEIW